MHHQSCKTKAQEWQKLNLPISPLPTLVLQPRPFCFSHIPGWTYLLESYIWVDLSALVIYLGGPFCLSKIPGRTFLPQSYTWEDLSASVNTWEDLSASAIYLGRPFCLGHISGKTFLPWSYIWEDLSASVIAYIWEDQAYVIQNVCLYPCGVKSMIQRRTVTILSL